MILDTTGESTLYLDTTEDIKENSITLGRPLLFFYDCETTGLDVYNECITELAAKVVAVPKLSVSQPTFSSLVKPTRNIPDQGK